MTEKPKYFLYIPRMKDGKQEVRPPEVGDWFLYGDKPHYSTCGAYFVSPILTLHVLDEDPREANKLTIHGQELRNQNVKLCDYLRTGYSDDDLEKAPALVLTELTRLREENKNIIEQIANLYRHKIIL